VRLFRIIAPVLCLAPLAIAQLTPAQKTADFMQLAGLYAKNYAPYQVKLSLDNFDLYNLQPWLDQINNSTTDIQFYDIMTRYVASLQDSHDEFDTPSDFEAWLHLDLDIYDGKVLIGDIDRSYLSTRKYPFQVGDELVSIDGTAAMDAVNALIPYAANGSGSKTSQMRLAAAAIADRLQQWNPTAPLVGDNATLVIKRQGTGNMETYTIPWDKTGTALMMAGPVPIAQARAPQNVRGLNFGARYRRGGEKKPNLWGVYSGPPAPMQADPVADYMQPIKKLAFGRAKLASTASAGIFPFENPYPAFDPPMGFKLHLGSSATDQFISGTFPVSGHTIGYIRVYTMEPTDESFAFNQFANEMVYMQKNSDGLIVDVMANGGGDTCYTQALATAVIPTTFRGLALDIRATSGWIEDFSLALTEAKQEGAPQWMIDLYTQYLQYVQQANSENRGLTGSLPLCSASFDTPPLTNSKGQVTAYSKPLLVLTDNYTLSAAELFTMFLQDSQRATIMGTRTDGGGGTVGESNNATDYTEGDARVTLSLITRAAPVATPGFPLGPNSIYYEGMGIYPDVTLDYQTLDNLLNGGQTFVNTAAAQMVKMIEQSSTVTASSTGN